ncbi:MAG: hypothetical protein AB9880_05615 [Christensenellales bacterium]
MDLETEMDIISQAILTKCQEAQRLGIEKDPNFLYGDGLDLSEAWEKIRQMEAQEEQASLLQQPKR